jgi:flagellar basal body-associated protein FliL
MIREHAVAVCQSCGNFNDEGDGFCASCGKPVEPAPNGLGIGTTGPGGKGPRKKARRLSIKWAPVIIAAAILICAGGIAAYISWKHDRDEAAFCADFNQQVEEMKKQMSFLNFEDLADPSNSISQIDIQVFVKSSASSAEISRLDDQIRSMSEVREMNFVSKEEALNRLREQLGDNGELLDTMSGNPLPPSFEIMVNDREKIEEVASRFYSNPLVDNSPGSHDGVKYSSDNTQRMQQQFEELKENIDRCS